MVKVNKTSRCTILELFQKVQENVQNVGLRKLKNHTSQLHGLENPKGERGKSHTVGSRKMAAMKGHSGGRFSHSLRRGKWEFSSSLFQSLC